MNGTRSQEITTLFSGDAIQTAAHSVANVIASGSSVLVMPNTSVKFLGKAVEVIHGAVSIATSEEMSARAYGLTITPAEKKESKFEVVEADDSVVVRRPANNPQEEEGGGDRRGRGDLRNLWKDPGYPRRRVGSNRSGYSNRGKQQKEEVCKYLQRQEVQM